MRPPARFLLSLALAAAAVAAQAAPSYRLTDIGPGFVSDSLRVTSAGVPFIRDFSPYRPPGFYAQEVDDSGLAIGARGSYSGNFQAALYRLEAGVLSFVRDLPFEATFPAWSIGWDLNTNGDFLGGATAGTYSSLQIIYADGTLAHLAGLSTYRAPSFNSSLQIVGADMYGGAFLYDATGFYLLESLVADLGGFQLRVPTDINDAGVIVGYGINAQGQVSAFLLTPNAVPEPATLVLVLVAFVALGAIARSPTRSRAS